MTAYIATLFRRERRLVARFVLTAIGRSSASAAVIFLIRDFLAGTLGGEGATTSSIAGLFGPEAVLWSVAVLLFAAYLVSALCTYANQVCEAHIVKVLEIGLMQRVLRHILSLSVAFLDRQSQGDIMQAVRQDVSHMRIVITSMANIVIEGMLALGLAVAAVSLAPWLALWALLAVPAASLPIYLVARRTLAQSYHVRKSGFVLFDVILQVIRGIRVIKAYQGEEAEARNVVNKARRYFDQNIELVRIRSLSHVALESLAGLGIVVVIVIGGLEVMRGRIEWPALLAFVMAVRAMHAPLNNVNTQYVQMKSLAAAVDRIDELLRTEPEVREAPDPRPLPHAPDHIRVDDVTFGYGETPVLEHVSFSVRAGESIGIAGPSGSGKSTLLNLLVRFYDPTAGRVLFDERDVRSYRLADVYDKVAIVTQVPFVFNTTVRENVRCGRAAATDAEVEAAARDAWLDEDIRALPAGYDTELGVGGRGLSGGQAQRLNIARAILKGAPILVLDEATSALDSVSEREVQRAIDAMGGGATTFVVAHRLSTLRNVDRILVLEAGRVAGFGPHDELMTTCAVYREMWEAQRLEERRDDGAGAGANTNGSASPAVEPVTPAAAP